jgi:4'-phosphopantetheinyl transferase
MTVPPLAAAKVHIWTASLDAADASLPELWEELVPDERTRADRFRTPQLRRRFIVARVFLRRLLKTYVPSDSPGLRIGYGSNGKPRLVDATDLRFNVSHAEDTALYAIASGVEVGIDIEATMRNVDVDGVARHAFSANECEGLAALAPDARREAFFRIWTRKEAYVKARGEGLSYPTRSFTVSCAGADNALLDDERDENARARWHVSDIEAPPGFAAALAIEGPERTVLRFDAALLLR